MSPQGESFYSLWIASYKVYLFSFNSVLVRNEVYSSVSELVRLMFWKSPLTVVNVCPKGKPGPKVLSRHSQDKRKLDGNLNFKFLSATNLELERLKIAFFKKNYVFPHCWWCFLLLFVGLKPGTEYEVTVIPMKDDTEGKPSSVSGRTGTWKVPFMIVMLLQGLGTDLSRSQHKRCTSCMTCSQVCLYLV